MRASLTIEGDWRGRPIAGERRIRLELELNRQTLQLSVDAPFYDDPAPAVAAGHCDRLWDYEVVELFLLGEGGCYTELELGPHGHFLGLRLEGVRRPLDGSVPIAFAAQIEGARWRGHASIERRHLPELMLAGNAYAIHGVGHGRRYLALHPVPGEAPDFHRLEHFRPLPWHA